MSAQQTDVDMSLAAVVKRHTPYEMSGREWGDERVPFVLYCRECACRAVECDVAVVLAELARLRAALVEERARFTHMNNYAKNCMPGMPPWDRPSRHDPRDDYRERARAELRAEGLLPED